MRLHYNTHNSLRDSTEKSQGKHNGLLLEGIVLLSFFLGACQHRIDPTVNPNYTATPQVKPTTEVEYLISQSQLPQFLRSDSNDMVQNTRDTENRIQVITNGGESVSGPASSTSPHSSTSHSAPQSPTSSPAHSSPVASSTITSTTSPTSSPSPSTSPAQSTDSPTPTRDTTSADALLSVNPSRCEWAVQYTPFKGTYASETWTSHSTLYTVIITSHSIDLDWVRDELHKCTHFQVHRLSSIQTIDRQYEHSTMLSTPFIAEYTVITSASGSDSSQKEISQSFTRRLITTLPDKKISIQINATIDHPFSKDDIIHENNLLLHQMQNIPAK